MAEGTFTEDGMYVDNKFEGPITNPLHLSSAINLDAPLRRLNLHRRVGPSVQHTSFSCRVLPPLPLGLS